VCSASTFLNGVIFCYWLLLVQVKSQLKGFRVAWEEPESEIKNIFYFFLARIFFTYQNLILDNTT